MLGYSFRKNLSPRILAAAAAVIISSFGISFAQECGQCSVPKVVLYDFKVLPPRPATDSLILKWRELFWPGFNAKWKVRESETRTNCITWYDGAVINAKLLQDNKIKFGEEYSNLPPAGPLKGYDYILSGFTGEIGGGLYESTLTLETAESREMVKAVSVQYKNEPDNISNAGTELAQKLGSILNVIEEFERRKRDTDNGVAISDVRKSGAFEDIKLTPAKNNVRAEESVDVEVEMTDCDGVPLGNRKIYFEDVTVNGMNFTGTTGGRVEPSIAETDGSGKVTVKFIAGKTPGLTQVEAFYPHKKPSGKDGGFIGTTAIMIEKPPAEKWILQVAITDKTIRNVDSSWSGPATGEGSYQLIEKLDGSAYITAIVENSSPRDSAFECIYYEDNGDVINSCTISGSGSRNYYRSYKQNPPFDIDIKNAFYQGMLSAGKTGFEFRYPAEAGDYVIAAQGGGTASGGSSWTHKNSEGKIVTESGSGSYSIGAYAYFLNGECSVTKTKSGYRITGTKTLETKNQGSSGQEVITRTMTLTATLNSDGTVSGVKLTDAKIPSSFRLEQNYPNPFNPSTKISYAIPEAGRVTLKVYNILGVEVETLINENLNPGSYTAEFDAGSLSSGIYFYRLDYNNIIYARKMLLIK